MTKLYPTKIILQYPPHEFFLTKTAEFLHFKAEIYNKIFIKSALPA